MLGDLTDIAGVAARFGNTFEDGGKVADRNAFPKEVLENSLNTTNVDLIGDKVRDQFLMPAVQFVEKFLRLGIGKEFRHVVADNFREMRCDHGGRIDNCEALEHRFFAMLFADPHGG